MAIGPCLVHEVWHWSHITRVNLLALAAEAERARADWERGGIFARLGMLLPVLWRARSVQPAALARALLPIPKSARIHPTAVIEACIIGEGVEVGPFACVRGSVLGEGCKIDAYANVNVSVIGPKAQAGRGAMINLCVLYAGAFVSAGGGFQMCVFGRDSFVAMTATMLDLSFGRTIRVDTPEGRMDTEGYFLGGAIGHGAKIGAGVRIGYGVAVPNDVLLVAPTGDLIRSIVPGEAGQALSATDGVARARPA
jgi:carbonic anhydrase/acetyltransferase-like protein (isoleucine patch superfamily)